MKNAIIAVMTVVCGYLLLHALGAFDFGSFIDREHRSHYASLRAEAVNASSAYVLGAVYDDGDWADVEAVQGAALAVDMVNSQGVTAGDKPYKLLTKSEAHTKTLNNAAMQHFADALDTAAVIGPFESVHIPSSRALTQFYALPLVSPVTVVSDKLPPLDPDNYVTLFPPLTLWTTAVLDHMEQHGVTKLFILSSGAGTYGDIFCTELERNSRRRQEFEQVFRLNYQEPLRRRDIERLLRNRAGEQVFQAIFFGGLYQGFVELSEILRDNHITLPVYGSDGLYSPDLKTLPRTFDLYLPRAIWKNAHEEFNSLWKERHGGEPGYHARFGAETVFLLADVLKELETYDTDRMVAALRERIQEHRNNPEEAPKIVIDAFPAAASGLLQ
ncbi:hypothetical protein LJB81_01790 [Desulfovibrio sp. OttesenSCG-928-M14]|nr:hypothetical protein [Desulfovibrio sp. OttesenSCG-928-M14]